MYKMNRFPTRTHGHCAVILRAKQSDFLDIAACLRVNTPISNGFLAGKSGVRGNKGTHRLVFEGFIATSSPCTLGRRAPVKLRVGYEMLYEFPQPTPVILV